MASDNQAEPLTYACRCLNIRITQTVSSSERPNYPSDPNYSSVFVNDDGIQVNHPQATVRLMSKPVPVPGTSKHSQFTALTCLFCALPVYRVHHIISLEVEGNAMTFLPSEEWVEKEILKSGTGWIDVHKNCLTTEDVAEALSVPSYVSLFAMTIPATLTFSTSPESNDDTDSSRLEVNRKGTTCLPNIPPVFLPPPFTPSNQVFTHLADIANTQSESIRSAAEERIQNFIRSEATGILEKEKIIKNQVLCFWKEFKQHLDELQLDMSTRKARSPIRLGDHGPNGFVSARGTALSGVRSFSPTPPSSSVRHAMSPPQPRTSALSASLATSTFHYPEESRVQSPEINCTSPGSSDDQTLDSRSISSTLVQSTTSPGEEANVLQYRRNIDDDINTQASFRYFANLEEEMERVKLARALESKKDKEYDSVQPSATSQPLPEIDTHTPQTTGAATSEGKDPQNETSPIRGRDKGKRKVTFDVKPVVVANENDVKVPAAPDQAETIFRLDDMVSEEGTLVSADDTQTTLPLLEQPPPRPVTIKRRSLNAGSEAFQSLRPASLPPPSHIRPMRSPPGVDSSHGILAPLTKAPSPTKAVPKVTTPAPPLNENEKHLLKLVAADTPSHRGAWIPGGDNWNMITGRKRLQDPDTSEEDEEDEDHTAQSTPTAQPSRILAVQKMQANNNERLLVGSLPINIKKIELPEPLSLASYVGQSVQPSEPVSPSTVSGKKQSASSIRKAAHFENDRARAIDPGPLDSVEEDDIDDDDDDIAGGEAGGEKARLQALRILQTRSELPEEGMWRSLA